MRRLLLVFIILFSIEIYARCPVEAFRPIYICNYKYKPKVSQIKGYTSGFWFFKKEVKYDERWHEVEFENLTVVGGNPSRITSHKDSTQKFTFFKTSDIDFTNIKIVSDCSDLVRSDLPKSTYTITAANPDFCKKYPENSLIEIGD